MSESRLRGYGGALGGFILGAFVGGMSCLIVCVIAFQREGEIARYIAEKEAVEPVLKADPAFNAVEIHEGGDGTYLLGKVPTDADKKRLEESVTVALGKTRASLMTLGVRAEKPKGR
jgi:hypothetical protein